MSSVVLHALGPGTGLSDLDVPGHGDLTAQDWRWFQPLPVSRETITGVKGEKHERTCSRSILKNPGIPDKGRVMAFQHRVMAFQHLVCDARKTQSDSGSNGLADGAQREGEGPVASHPEAVI